MRYIISIHSTEFMGDGKQAFLVESKSPKKAIHIALACSLPLLSEEERFTGYILELESPNVWAFSARVGGEENSFKVRKLAYFNMERETGSSEDYILNNFPLIKDTGEKIKSTFFKLKNYKELKKLYKAGHKFLIVTGIDMRFENLIWNFWDLSFRTKKLYNKGKRVNIIVLKTNQMITSEHPLMIENRHIENFLGLNKDIKIFPGKFE